MNVAFMFGTFIDWILQAFINVTLYAVNNKLGKKKFIIEFRKHVLPTKWSFILHFSSSNQGL